MRLSVVHHALPPYKRSYDEAAHHARSFLLYYTVTRRPPRSPPRCRFKGSVQSRDHKLSPLLDLHTGARKLSASAGDPYVPDIFVLAGQLPTAIHILYTCGDASQAAVTGTVMSASLIPADDGGSWILNSKSLLLSACLCQFKRRLIPKKV
jgi:hypothetical protein